MVIERFVQMNGSHGGGLFMGVHWVWWVAWALVLASLAWGFARVYGERAEIQRRRRAEDAAEAALRARLADGEIDEDEFSERMRALRAHHTGR